MNLVLPEGARKLGGGGGGGGEEGMQLKGYICTCPVVLHRFVDICQQVFRLFLRMTQHVIYSRVYVIINGSMCGWGGGGQLLPEGWHFICHGGGGGGGGCWPPPPRLCLIQGCRVST